MMPLGAAGSFVSVPMPVLALDLSGLLSPDGAIGFALLFGLLVFSLTTAIVYVRERSRWQQVSARQSDLLERSEAGLATARACLTAEPQVVISWPALGEPRIDADGQPGFLVVSGARVSPLAFGLWAVHDDARALDQATDRLRAGGQGFERLVRSRDGRFVEAAGRAVTGRVVLQLREVSEAYQKVHDLTAQLDHALNRQRSVEAIVRASGHLAWQRDADGRLVWVNEAYVRAVDAADPADAVARQLELLDRDERELAEQARRQARSLSLRAAAVVSGTRRMLDVREVPLAMASPHAADPALPVSPAHGEGGWIGVALDVSEIESVRSDLQREMAAHVRTLDRLPIGVAVFDGKQRLIYHNTAYASLWGLSEEFLAGHPSDAEILDKLRADRRLPELGSFRDWRADLFKAYSAVAPIDHEWYLPDGKTMRVTANPNPQGGVTYLFDDATERLSLEQRLKAQSRVQAETLDTLSEGVAVFGSDGCLKLSNPAFALMWKLSPALLAAQPHVDELLPLCQTLHRDGTAWQAIRGAIVGVRDSREGASWRMTRVDGSVADAVMAPLPEGATLLTFTDVTASVNVERALTDRNEALESASRLRDEFVHHVSYELRSPLTTIIGFAQIMGQGMAGPLTPKQREYADAILRSSGTLLAIVNDILDLASIDTEQLKLEITDVDLNAVILAAVKGLDDRLATSQISIDIAVSPLVQTLRGDSRRLTQVFYNLLSNAIGFSEEGQRVRVVAEPDGRDVVISVIDQGRGIPQDVQTRVFERFETHTSGSRHRGAGLGLSIVHALIKLHGGDLTLESTPGRGTRVMCRIPRDPPGTVADAAE